MLPIAWVVAGEWTVSGSERVAPLQCSTVLTSGPIIGWETPLVASFLTSTPATRTFKVIHRETTLTAAAAAAAVAAAASTVPAPAPTPAEVECSDVLISEGWIWAGALSARARCSSLSSS